MAALWEDNDIILYHMLFGKKGLVLSYKEYILYGVCDLTEVYNFVL